MCNQNEISNMIGYHQPDLSTNMTVYVSCLWLDSVTGHLKGQLTRQGQCKWTKSVCNHTRD